MNEFEEWMGHYDCCPTPEAYSAAKAAYQAGAAAMRERCAEVAEADIQEHAITITAAQQETHNQCCRYIAAAIRGMEI